MFRPLHPSLVVITREAEEDERCARRVERMLSAMDAPEVLRDVTDEQLAALVEERGWRHVRRWGEVEQPTDPPIVLNTLKFGHTEAQRRERLERFPALRAARLHGYFGLDFRSDGTARFRRAQGRICQSAWELHTICGCPFRCAYCNFGPVIHCGVNIEEFLDYLDRRIRELDPPQTLYKWDNITDISAFEPEYDATRLLVDYFARQEHNRLLLYVGKSDNVDFMLDYPHRGHTLIQWSVSARTQSTLVEPETAPWDARVEAAAKCQAAGYTVRFRFSPILPVRGWRQENRELIELMFQKTRPDIVVLHMFGWMPFSAAACCLDLSLLEEKYVAAMQAAEPWLADRRYGPLPHEARAEIYGFLLDEIGRVSPDTSVALCLETPAMWAHFGRRPPEVGEPYPCVCGPYCTPGHPQFLPA